MKLTTLVICMLFFVYCGPSIDHDLDPVEKVNVLIGTTGPIIEYGGLSPWVATPHGMTDWTPMNQENQISRTAYRSDNRTLIGFIGTHQPTIWMGDYGFLTLMPEVGSKKILPEDRRFNILPGSENAKPYYYSVKLECGDQKNIQVEMTASTRCAIFKLNYPDGAESNLFFEMSRLRNSEGWIKISEDHREIIGYNPDMMNIFQEKYMGPELKSFKGYFIIQFEKPFNSFVTWEYPDDQVEVSNTDIQIYDSRNELEGARIGTIINFAENENIKIKIASSFISFDQARENLVKEIPDWNFEEVANKTKNKWNDVLNRIKVEGATPDQQTILYTAIYHSVLYPRTFDEYGRYYSAFDEKVHEGISYNDYSMWDTFRALHPLFTLIEPEHVSPMIQSMVQMYKEGGWIPKWPNPSYSNIMIGSPADAIIADAYVKGFKDYDVNKAYEAIYKNAMTPPDGDEANRWTDRADWTAYEARAGLTYYKELGYIPADKTDESVSRTLEDAYADYCVAQVAKGLGKEDDYKFFMQRSQNYRNLFNPVTGFMQPRLSNGKFYDGDPEKYRSFTEGSPWTYLFCVMQDVPGLIDLMGRDNFISKLDENFDGGHYAYGNEPENHYPYLYAWVDQPWKTQKIVTDVINYNYKNTPDGIQGNDDCGQMSAWYIFTVLGFYPVTPASNEYVIGRPFFPKISIELNYPKKNVFTVIAHNLTPENIYVKSVKLDGKPLESNFIKHSDLFEHKTLEFEMSNTPNHVK